MKLSPLKTSVTGVVFYSPSECSNGMTLITPAFGKELFLVDMQGRVVNRWELPLQPVGRAKLTNSGTVLVAGKVAGGPVDREGASGVIMELDWKGNKAWEYRDSLLHDDYLRLDNGNTLVTKWIALPSDFVAKVQGGLQGTELNGNVYGDVIQEISPSGVVVWEWKGHEHLDPETQPICNLCARAEWTHATAIDVFDDGRLVVNLMRTNTVIIVNRQTGAVEWAWGSDQLSHPNTAMALYTGNVMVFDNGRHIRGEAMSYSRPLEVDPDTGNIIWGYEEDPPSLMYTSFLGNAQRLPNGSTLVVEGTAGHLLELSYRGHTIWEYVLPSRYESDVYGNNNYVAGAYRYGLDHKGLRIGLGMGDMEWKLWADVSPAGKSAKKSAASAEAAVRNRLEHLGY